MKSFLLIAFSSLCDLVCVASSLRPLYFIVCIDTQRTMMNAEKKSFFFFWQIQKVEYKGYSKRAISKESVKLKKNYVLKHQQLIWFYDFFSIYLSRRLRYTFVVNYSLQDIHKNLRQKIIWKNFRCFFCRHLFLYLKTFDTAKKKRFVI